MLVAPATSSLHAAARCSLAMQQSSKLESPIPWLPRPAYLDGSLAGDVGLDPLNLVTRYSHGVTVTVPGMETTVTAAPEEFKNLKRVKTQTLVGVPITLGPNTQDTKRSLMWYREAEIKHARLAMLAAAGWPLAELWHGPLSNMAGAPYALDITQGRSLSVLNGGLSEVAPFLLLVTAAISYIEISTLDQVYGLTATGKTMKPDGNVVIKSYVPGDCGFDPLNLYGVFGSQPGAMNEFYAQADPNYAVKLAEDARREMETAEIKNGRLAMLAITGFALQEFVYGTPVVDQTPIFFTFFGDVLAPGALASLGLW
uniref:Chlorophyll a-b binding protein, chloroplastic n=1 Tax=Haptolina brevifila TaxID=156173 RepID=A0A7S2IN08_9EUKA|mmetsp:Transcript_68756/g.136243  ORF Transcript_68756/g.136243 Transcript_68756/m.136243 type:complete len:313 (+) Transcript_68756:31-969(+)|eukprot:CAMPEP_0174718918 /NCGR_PEP_ID=MMETSP1094-20130205/30354_1 /TAXON_ID=156173 /ORGANISM="Chrysochromulina brevifilum, Strain UTEX LB 985" /LENGTH=312 /DNA_ID=CAMNT_0015919135 /DNA_START=30 /DNA_END=968 /DNA_ORIENTATION=+